VQSGLCVWLSPFYAAGAGGEAPDRAAIMTKIEPIALNILADTRSELRLWPISENRKKLL